MSQDNIKDNKHNAHYVPWSGREWVMCLHPFKDCTAMGYAGLCGRPGGKDCEHGHFLSSEEIKRGINSSLASFGVYNLWK